MKRKGSIFGCLFLALFLIMAVPALADEVNMERSPVVGMDVASVIDYLEAIDFGVEITFFPLEQEGTSSRSHSHDVQFDTIRELEEYIRVFIEAVDSIEEPTYTGFNPMTNRRTISWLANTPSGVPTRANIEYSLSGANSGSATVHTSWTNVNVGNSWSHGSNGGGWALPEGNRIRLNVTANGFWTIGLGNVGYTFRGTLTFNGLL